MAGSQLCASAQKNSPIQEHGLPSSDEVRARTAPNESLALLRKDLDELLPERVEVCADSPASTVTKTTQTASILGSEAWNHCVPRYTTLYARVKNKRYTLAVRRLKDGDTANSVAEFFGVLGLDAGVKAEITVIARILRQ